MLTYFRWLVADEKDKHYQQQRRTLLNDGAVEYSHSANLYMNWSTLNVAPKFKFTGVVGSLTLLPYLHWRNSVLTAVLSLDLPPRGQRALQISGGGHGSDSSLPSQALPANLCNLRCMYRSLHKWNKEFTNSLSSLLGRSTKSTGSPNPP